jgi:hypothetical protein
MTHVRATRRTVTIVTTLVALALALATSVAEATPTEVNVRIEGRTRTLFEGPILTEGHAVSSFKLDGGEKGEDIVKHPCDGTNNDQHETPGPTPTAGAVDAMELAGESQAMAGRWNPGFDDYFVKQWGSESENAEVDGSAWGVLVNNVFTSTGGCEYELAAGGEVLWTYNVFDSRPFLALFAAGTGYTAGERPLTATAQLGKPLELEVLAYEDDAEDVPPPEPKSTGAAPIADIAVSPVSTSAKGFEKVELESAQTVSTDAQGRASITFTTPGWHRLKAGGPIDPETGEEETIRSNRLDVCVPPEGESGCGAPPAEDRLRVPSRYQAAIGPTPENWNAPRISGQAIMGQTVTVGEGLWTGTEPLQHTYRWQRCDSSGDDCEEIPAATAATHSVLAGDEGHTLRAVVTAGNGAGSAEKQSPPTSEVPFAPSVDPGPGPETILRGPGTTSGPAGQTLPAQTSRTAATVTVARLAARSLVLRISVAGRVTVQISRRIRHRGKLTWRAFKTLTVKAGKAGAITIKLPALGPGSYRLAIALAGSKPVFRVLTVHRR